MRKTKQRVFVIILSMFFITSIFFVKQVASDDTTPPSITINFAGNLSDIGGPYWTPPGESIPLTGDWENGYFVNDSDQQDDHILINCSITDDVSVSSVMLHWYNVTGDVWDNTTSLIQGSEDFWEINTSEIIVVGANCKYTFDIAAADSSGNAAVVFWNKTGKAGTEVRRYVTLKSTPTNISYEPFYLFEALYPESASDKYDRLQYDGGANGNINDTGYVKMTELDDSMSDRFCFSFCGYYFNGNVSTMQTEVTSLYVHTWWSISEPSEQYTFFSKTRESLMQPITDYYYAIVNQTDRKSTIVYDIGIPGFNDTYTLNTYIIPCDFTFTDNSFYEYFILFLADSQPNISVISNKSIQSFVIPNIPDNETLNTTDWTSRGGAIGDRDGDGLPDWIELYINGTNPFLNDTDQDGKSDYEETHAFEHGLLNSDPNNYTDKTDYTYHSPVITNPSPANGSINQELSLSWAVDLSADNNDFNWTIECSNGQSNSANNDDNGTKTLSISGLSYSTGYTAWINITDGINWLRKWFTFTTKTHINNPPSFSNENPANGSANQELSLIWSIDIVDADGDAFYWTIECSNGDTNSSVADDNGTKNLTVSGLDYLNTLTIWVNATDGTDTTSRWYTFTTKTFVPGAPSSLYAKTKSDTRIDLSWAAAAGADKTYVVAKLSSAPSSRTDGINIYNGTGEFYSSTNLSENQHWYYRAYSWNNTYATWSTLYASANTTTSPAGGNGSNGGNGGTTEPPKPPVHEGESSPIIKTAVSLGIMFPILVGAITVALLLIFGKINRKRKTAYVKKKAIDEYEQIDKKTADQRDRQRAYRLLDKR